MTHDGGAAGAEMRQEAIRCDWRCGKCSKAGQMDVWPYALEAPHETANRQARWTRATCLEGCQFSASAAQQEQKDGANDVSIAAESFTVATTAFDPSANIISLENAGYSPVADEKLTITTTPHLCPHCGEPTGGTTIGTMASGACASLRAPEQPLDVAWLLIETWRDGSVHHEGIATTHAAKDAYMRQWFQPGHSRSALPRKLFKPPAALLRAE